MEQLDVVRHAVTALERLGLKYAIVGSFASMAYGEPRFTRDLDILLELSAERVAELCREFPAPDWYISERAAVEAIRRRGQFNAIHTLSGNKIDFILPRDDPWGRQQLERRQAIGVVGDLFGFAAHPEDVILGKLLYFKEGGSDKHLRDITSMLEISGPLIDRARLTDWAERLQVSAEWQAVLMTLLQRDTTKDDR